MAGESRNSRLPWLPSGEVREVTCSDAGAYKPPWAKRATIIVSQTKQSASASSALTRGFDFYFNRYLVLSEYTGCRSEDSELATIPDLADTDIYLIYIVKDNKNMVL